MSFHCTIQCYIILDTGRWSQLISVININIIKLLPILQQFEKENKMVISIRFVYMVGIFVLLLGWKFASRFNDCLTVLSILYPSGNELLEPLNFCCLCNWPNIGKWIIFLPCLRYSGRLSDLYIPANLTQNSGRKDYYILLESFLILLVRGTQIFQNSRIHLNILDARRLT